MEGNQPIKTSQTIKTFKFNEIIEDSWALLKKGVQDRKTMAHTPVVSSIGLDGLPRSRTMVLRDVDKLARTLNFNTDNRSPKVGEFALNPRASVLIYEASEKIQLRLSCKIVIHKNDQVSDLVWSKMRNMSQQCYKIKEAPGTKLNFPDFLELEESGRKNFCVLKAEIETLEWLYLSAAGNRRAIFDWRQENEIATWLVA